MAGRPTLIRGDSQLFFPGMGQPMVFSADETTDIGYESGTTSVLIAQRTAAGSPARSTGCKLI
jgi:hypothetical protein